MVHLPLHILEVLDSHGDTWGSMWGHWQWYLVRRRVPRWCYLRSDCQRENFHFHLWYSGGDPIDPCSLGFSPSSHRQHHSGSYLAFSLPAMNHQNKLKEWLVFLKTCMEEHNSRRFGFHLPELPCRMRFLGCLLEMNCSLYPWWSSSSSALLCTWHPSYRRWKGYPHQKRTTKLERID